MNIRFKSLFIKNNFEYNEQKVRRITKQFKHLVIY